ncbi:MAG: DsrE family protein [Sulfurimicrobium sp.]|jgi:uncharacterized protein involved in oxidation of intracellular sulfur|nr:DsrE family protein [Sulfurimicrobium sp.]MDP1898709.1 DsrE family protein [Sulfurimicrobium sp.]MDP2197409.1 DsrE family protein [Sulfurimicrobium sp.]MDP2963434.1 DsrE family protein [Sulfurimicrobium sp.]MDP3686046.1 DsrE family protein [Sulfurimicrobium sp.]
MKTLFILNDPPYGTERSYNGLRLARALSKNEGNEIRVFLLGDAALCAKSGQKVPQGYYSIGFMLESILRRNAQVGVCGTCLEARGIQDSELIEGAHHSTMDQLAEWTEWADKVLVL